MNFLRNLIQGTQSASKTDSGQKKKGAPAPPVPGGPEESLDREANGLKDTVPAQSDVCVTQPSSPSLPPANVFSPSVTKESESTAEDTSFTSCLTEEASTLSECCVLPSQDVTPVSESLSAPAGAHQADPLSNSVSDSVALNITQNGVKKDSEYESAEELESPSSTAVVEEPTSASANTAPNQTQSADQGPDTLVPIKEKEGVNKNEEETTKTEVIQNSGPEETGSQLPKEAINGHQQSDPKDLENTISDSLVTVTKSEIIEESIQVLPEVNLQESTTENKSQGETRIVTTEIVETNGNLSEVHARLSTTENPPLEDRVKENICNGDQIISEDITDNLNVNGPVSDDKSNSNHIEEPIKESEKTVLTEVKSNELPPSPALNTDPEDLPIPPKRSYNLDFLDNLDDPNFNPFATKTAVRNTPPPSPEPGRKPLKPTVSKKKQVRENSKTQIATKEAKPKEDNKCEQEHKLTENKEELKTVNSVPEQKPVVPEADQENKEKQDLLEISFEDSSKPIKRPPRNLGKKPPAKPSVKKTVEKNNNTVVNNTTEVKSESEVKSEPEEELPIPPSKGYNLDFLDNLEDPNFNPFATKTTVSNSPPKEGFVKPGDKEEQNIKPKPKVVTPKKSPAKKGFSVIKNKTKTEKDSSKVVAPDHSKQEAPIPTSQDSSNKPTETEGEEESIAVPRKGYDLAFLDDPNFDPFQTRSSFESKPTSSNQNIDTAVDKPKDKVSEPVNESIKDNTSSESIKPSEESGKPEEQEPKRLGAEGSESPLPSVSKQQPSEKEVEDQEKSPKEATGLQDQQAKQEVQIPETVSSAKAEVSKETSVEEKRESTEENPKVAVEEVQIVKDQTKLEVQPQVPEEKDKDKVEAKHQIVDEKTKVIEEKEKVAEVKPQVAEVKPQIAVVKPQVVEVKPLVQEELPQQQKDLVSADTCDKSDSVDGKQKEIFEVSERVTEEAVKTGEQQSNSTSFPEINLPKVPSIGRIGQLDSLEFAQLLGNEASRLAEEFMNCSCDSGLPDSDDSSSVKCTNSNSNMDSNSKAAHLDENVNPFMRNSRLARSPPLGKRGAVCGAESGDTSESMDAFKPRRALRREEIMGEERQDTLSLDEDSGIVMPTRSDLEVEVNHSEAGPEIATGLTSSDLRCASQFFKEASDMERQFRRNLSTPMGSQSKLSGDEVTPIKEKPEHPSVTPDSPQNKPVPSTSTPIPPREERSAPEGTSSPTPRPSDTSEHKPSSSRPLSVPADGYVTTAEVEELLKRQSLQFEEKLLRAELAAGEKEKKLIQAMKEEQKEKGNLGGSLSELTQSRDALLKMVGQYKGMLAQLVGEKEKDKQGAEERIKTLETERNQALDDLANVENAFSDVHRKYERTKQVVDTLRRNEETLRGAITDYESKLQKQEQKFIEFQKHAEEKIQLANEEFETMRKANEQEMTKMAALLKKAEMKIVSLQDAFDRKTRENQELTQLCDDLINKVGGTN